MDVSVLELGLRNQQLSTVKCFLKINIETFRMTWSKVNIDAEDAIMQNLVKNWQLILSKLILVIKVNIIDDKSKSFALSVSKIFIDTINQLLKILAQYESSSNFHFENLLMENIKIIRHQLNASHVNQFDAIQSKREDDQDEGLNTIEEALRLDRLTLTMYLMKKNNADIHWNEIIKKGLKIAILSLFNDDFEVSSNILMNLGFSINDFYSTLYIHTSSQQLRQILVNILAISEDDKATLDFIFLIENSKLGIDLNFKFNIKWTKILSDDSKSNIATALLLKTKQESQHQYLKYFNSQSVWKYFLNKNHANKLCKWIDSFDQNHVDSSEHFYSNWPITTEMIELCDQVSSVYTKESILNQLLSKNLFCQREAKDINLTLHRIGRANQYNSEPAINFTSFFKNKNISSEFGNKIIDYCEKHQLYEFLYLYIKMINNNFNHESFLIKVLRCALHCSRDSTSDNIVQFITLILSLINQTNELHDLYHMINENSVYLLIICLAFIESESKKKDYLTFLFQNSAKLNLKSQLSIIHEVISSEEVAFSPQSRVCQYEHQTIYNLLKETIPFDLSKLFCWQTSNNLNIRDNSSLFLVFNELPHFSHEKLANLYGIKANLTYSYYIAQGRPIEAYIKYLANRKTSNSKSIESSCKRASLVAYSNTSNIQVANSAILFHYLMKEDISSISLHLAVSNLISSYSAIFLGTTTRQQQFELNDLIKKAQYYSDKKAALKLLELIRTSITRKYKNYDDIKIEECFDWKLAAKFANVYNLELPIDFLIKCAQADHWLLFLLYTQIHQYPKLIIINCLNEFNNKVIAGHLEKVYQTPLNKYGDGRESSSKLFKFKTPKDTSAKHLRNVLYSKIGLNKSVTLPQSEDDHQSQVQPIGFPRRGPTSRSFSIDENDEMRSITDFEVNSIETISMISGSAISDGEMTKFDESNAPKDLFQVLGLQSEIYSTQKFLLYNSISLSNPILSLIASSMNIEKFESDKLSCFSCWLLSSVDYETRKTFCEELFEFYSWTLNDYLRLVKFIFQKDSSNYLTYYKGLQLFGFENSPLNDLFQFLCDFLVEKVYEKTQDLKIFQENLWNLDESLRINENVSYKEWIETTSVTALTNSLKVVENSYELRILLRHYDLSKIQDTFSKYIEIADFRKLYRLNQCLEGTNVKLPLKDLLITPEILRNSQISSVAYFTIIERVVFQLQQYHFFNEAKQFANISGTNSTTFVINEWLIKAEMNSSYNNFEFWYEFWNNLDDVDPLSMSLLKTLKKIINQVSVPIVKTFLVFKCFHLSLLRQLECFDLEIQLWKLIIDLQINGIEPEFIDYWNKLWNEIIGLVKLREYFQMHQQSDFNKKISKIKINNFDVVISKLLDSFCIDEAYQIADSFNFNDPELDIILACHNIAKGKIKNFSEMPLSIQLSSNSLKHNKEAQPLDISDDQKEMIELLEHMCSLTVLSQKACHKILLYFKISCIINQTYIEVIKQDQIEIIKKLIASTLYNTDSLNFAKELIMFNNISDEFVASIICNEVIIAIKNSLIEVSATEGSVSSSEVGGSSFLSLVRLLNDPSVLGRKLSDSSDTSNVIEENLYNFYVSEILIKAHECFTIACDVKGISLVLKRARILITLRLIQSKDYNNIIRLLTGIGRYSEMTYCFDIIKDNDQFEMLLSKKMEKVPQLRVALIDYLKGDKERFPLVALGFCLFREIAEAHESSAFKLYNKLELNKSQSLISFKESLERITDEFIDASHSYAKAGCYSHAEHCAKMARLISLQTQYLPGNIIIIKLTNDEVANFISNCTNFLEALIVAESYQHNQSWSQAIFNNVILKNDWNYFRDFISQKQLTIALIEEVTKKYKQLMESKNCSSDKLSVIRKSMQRWLTFNEDLESKFTMSWELGIIEATNKLLQDQSASYLHDLRRNGYL